MTFSIYFLQSAEVLSSLSFYRQIVVRPPFDGIEARTAKE